MLFPGQMALLIQHPVKIAAGQTVVGAGFEVDDDADLPIPPQLGNAPHRQHAAGVGAGAADLTDQPAAVFSIERGHAAEQHGGRVVEDHDVLAGDPALFQLRQQRSADKLPFAAGDDHFLVDLDHAPVDLRRDDGREGKAEADIVRKRQQRLDRVRHERNEFLPADRLPDAGHSGLFHVGQHGAALREADQPAAEVRAAGVNDDGAAAGVQTPVDAQIGRDHGHHGAFAPQPLLHGLLHPLRFG